MGPRSAADIHKLTLDDPEVESVGESTIYKVLRGERTDQDTLYYLFRVVKLRLEEDDFTTEQACKTPQANPAAWNPRSTPEPFIGRTDDLHSLKSALGIIPEQPGVKSRTIAMYGLPGVGKSTFAAWLTRDPDILRAYPDAVLWTALGQADAGSNPDNTACERLRTWGKLLGDGHLDLSMTADQLADRIEVLLRNRRALLICDDVWKLEEIKQIRRLADGNVRLLITSRFSDIALRAVPYDDAVIKLKVFAESDALTLLELIAPAVVNAYPEASRELVRDLEYLPLAISVAANMLKREMHAGLNVSALIDQLRDEAIGILEQPLPIDMQELTLEQHSGTVLAWLMRSIRMLDPDTRACFISLGELLPKPAQISLRVMTMNWEGLDAHRIVRNLVDAGLLQATGDGKYQMHAMLVTLAKYLDQEGVNG
jgi:hypothetical protein